MKKTPLTLASVLAVLLLAACTHHHPANQADSAVVNDDATYTGQRATPVSGVYPRATLVAPPSTASETAVEPSVTIASTGTTPAETAPASPEPSTPAPAPTPERLTATPPPPLLSTNPPVAASDATSNEAAVIDTSYGRIVIELDDFAAPATCNNFRKLVSDGFYNQTAFHRVIPHFMIQGGDPNTKAGDRSTYGKGDPGYTLPAEIQLKHDRGAVAMARLPDSVNPKKESNGSQFYICLAACPSLDNQYTVFGHVLKGMDVAAKIAAQPKDAQNDPLEKVAMTVSLQPTSQALDENAAVSP